MPKIQSSIVVLMIIMAIVFGVGGYLILAFLQNRPDTPEGTVPQLVNDTEVLLTFNPENAVRIVGAAGPAIGAEGVQPQVQLPTDNTTQTQPLPAVEPTQEQLNNTAQQAVPPTETPPPPTAAPTPVPEKIIIVQYQVQGSDSLYSISERIDTSIALMASYGLSSTSLTPGAVIDLPVGNPAYCPGRRPYAIGEGDTAFSIGRRFGITAQDLQAINGLDANFTVRVADIICVP